MAAEGNHTFAVVKGKEDYETLQSSFTDVFQAINTLINKKEIDLEFFMVSDYKLVLRNNITLYVCMEQGAERWPLEDAL